MEYANSTGLAAKDMLTNAAAVFGMGQIKCAVKVNICSQFEPACRIFGIDVSQILYSSD